MEGWSRLVLNGMVMEAYSRWRTCKGMVLDAGMMETGRRWTDSDGGLHVMEDLRGGG